MSKILVLGGGVIGLSTAMMLVRRGHDVTVFERDSEPLPGSPEDAWRAWERRGVAQFRQPHYLHPSAMQLLDSHLPNVKQALIGAGCISFDMLATMPATSADRTPRDGDQRFKTITGRRSTIEYAATSVAERHLPIRRGVSVASLLTGPSAAKGIPHVTGVRTMDGEEVSADLIIDATGRASKLPDWLEAIGARRPIEEAEDSGFIYYSRFFRSRNGAIPAVRTGQLTHFHSFSLLTLPGDAGTWSVTVYISSGEQALKKLRDSKHWQLSSPRARCTPTGSTESRSPTCYPWAASLTAIGVLSWTAHPSQRGSSVWATRGPANPSGARGIHHGSYACRRHSRRGRRTPGRPT